MSSRLSVEASRRRGSTLRRIFVDAAPKLRMLGSDFWPPIVAIAALLAIWQAFVMVTQPPVYLLPSPGAVMERIAEDPLFFAGATGITVGEALLGLLVGAGFAFVLGVLMAHSRPLERGILPMAILMKVTPVVTVAPLFLIWFGFGITSKVLVAALITFFPTIINTVTGLRSIDGNMLDVMRSMNASKSRIFWHLRLPTAMPFLFSAIKVSVPLSLIGAVVGEWVGADRGIGHTIMLSHSLLDMPTLFGGIAFLAASGVIVTAGIAMLERAVLHWHASTFVDDT